MKKYVEHYNSWFGKMDIFPIARETKTLYVCSNGSKFRKGLDDKDGSAVRPLGRDRWERYQFILRIQETP